MLTNNVKQLLTNLLCISCFFLTACVHRPDVQQGNVITQESIAALSIGMAKNKVKSIVGTPLIIDPFQTKRWEYVYSMKSPDNEISQYSYVTLTFDENILSEIEIHQQPLKEDDIRSMEISTKKKKI